jgi:hypothetical protein
MPIDARDTQRVGAIGLYGNAAEGPAVPEKWPAAQSPAQVYWAGLWRGGQAGEPLGARELDVSAAPRIHVSGPKLTKGPALTQRGPLVRFEGWGLPD